jgi:hypothetical protein
MNWSGRAYADMSDLLQHCGGTELLALLQNSSMMAEEAGGPRQCVDLMRTSSALVAEAGGAPEVRYVFTTGRGCQFYVMTEKNLARQMLGATVWVAGVIPHPGVKGDEAVIEMY